MTRGSPKGAQTAFRLPAELHEKLTGAAEAAGCSLGEEIRRRLEASFEPPAPRDMWRDALARVVTVAAEEVRDQYADWHADPFSFEVFKLLLGRLLDLYGPKGEPVPQPNPGGKALQLWGENPVPAEVAHALTAGAYIKTFL